ncbi:hypothetical protein RM704_44950, partial [Streptomyces sp. DSM 3412]
YEAVAKNLVAKLTQENFPASSAWIRLDQETSSVQAKSQHRRVSRILCSQMLATMPRRVSSFVPMLLDQQKWRKVVARMFE